MNYVVRIAPTNGLPTNWVLTEAPCSAYSTSRPLTPSNFSASARHSVKTCSSTIPTDLPCSRCCYVATSATSFFVQLWYFCTRIIKCRLYEKNRHSCSVNDNYELSLQCSNVWIQLLLCISKWPHPLLHSIINSCRECRICSLSTFAKP